MKCAEFVEVDVRLSRDRVPVIIHDADLDRTTNGRGQVGEMTIGELAILDAGEGEHIPSLCEVCELVKGECGLFVEIKEPGSEMEVCAVLDREAPSPLWVVSFHYAILETVSEILPDAVTGLIYSRPLPGGVGFAVRKNLQALLPRFDLLSLDLVVAAHERGIKVVPWTLNEPLEWARAVESGVDGFATDNPCAAEEWKKKTGN